MDTTVGLLIVAILMAVAFFSGLRWLIRARSQYGGARVVTCPDTEHPASVEVDALHTALTSAIGFPDIRLQNCSRWPVKKDCGQECLLDLDVAPDECLVRGVLMKWYRGKKCVSCKTTFGDLHVTDHKPALRNADGELLVWSQVSLAGIGNVIQTHQPICWNCYIAQSFVKDHPELVVYRPWKDVALEKHEQTTSRPLL